MMSLSLLAFAAGVSHASGCYAPSAGATLPDLSPVVVYWVRVKDHPQGLIVRGRVKLRRGSGTPLSGHLHIAIKAADGRLVTGETRWLAPLNRRHRSADFRLILPAQPRDMPCGLRITYSDERHDAIRAM